LRKRGGKIDDDSPKELLHRLRIDAKKLRYLLTFFRSLYPTATIDALVTALKKLQDNLGDFNDYGVQQAAMKDFAERMLAEGAPVTTIMAMGRLVERLESGEAKERRKFRKRFREFTSKGNRALFRELFGPDGSGEKGAPSA
jgi:CHAD domain-containing protein